MCWRLFICAVSALLLAISPAAAQGRVVRPYGPDATVPLERILPQIRSAHPGSFSDVDGPFADERDGHDERYEMRSEGRCQEVSKRGDHVTRSADCQEYSQYAGQERRSRNKVSDRDALNSEKYHADGKDLHLKRQSGQ